MNTAKQPSVPCRITCVRSFNSFTVVGYSRASDCDGQREGALDQKEGEYRPQGRKWIEATFAFGEHLLADRTGRNVASLAGVLL
jgi:hypothetical protein